MTARLASLESYYRGRRVLVTGHTGFKGAWLSLALSQLGADVSGLALPPTGQGVYSLARVRERLEDRRMDIRDRDKVAAIVREIEPEVVFHLAAQALVPDSFRDPVGTFDVNVVGTASVLSACMAADSVRAVVAVTSDKVYANDGKPHAFRESDRLGGGDPYSASKAAVEMVVDSWRYSFLSSEGGGTFALGSARAGNVIGGGDRGRDRVVPDIVDALSSNRSVRLRNPRAVRPWQFVLEPVVGYLEYAMHLGADQRSSNHIATPAALNFGPSPASSCTVSELAEEMARQWGGGDWVATDDRSGPEAPVLLLDSSAANQVLGWQCRLGLQDVVRLTVEWYRLAQAEGDCAELSLRQLDDYLAGLDDRPIETTEA